ncbi:SDR family NAD(P)-dependent oxidoreductase [Petroclostridium sp. X23]|uniref:SDR family NAD(P)-dependent oxidoreductase n=1 Tax=Petroclostridium sp. X23 TaxID=3045146 RepID=UPI0024ADFCA2|nr:SDR family NAD(P)-dependent oxidoreductase [Petroclostridium sp. X23]WHH61257.1 SDR family NAD(P)-dependent oxidoreductase [Petroclostridium sp. X23]
MDYLKVKGKSAIITGGGSGIGEGIAVEFAKYGIKLMLCDINDENGQRVVEKINSQGGTAIYCHADVSKLEDVKNLVSETIKNFNVIDILVNNAGIGSKAVPFWTISYEEWDRMIQVDLTSAFMCTKEVFPNMKERNYGKIINISSGSGLIGGEWNTHYTAAKAGMNGMTRSIAREVAKYKINVNAISVNTTLTPLAKATGWNDFVPPDIPWGRLATPLDVANVALYLASDSSEYMTGQLLAPCGGRRTPI